MNQLNLEDVRRYVEDNIHDFHDRRLKSLDKLELKKILKRKNPYLFKAKNMLTAEQIIKSFVDAHLSSNEETIFGDWLENLAVYINGIVYNGRKSSTTGMDLEFDKDGVRYIVNIKSGPNWCNSSQKDKMVAEFKKAAKTLRTSQSDIHVVAVNGCCYGIDNNPDKGSYYKYCGQRFWEFISGNSELYTDIVEPLGYKAKEKNDEFDEKYSQKINQFTLEFLKDFCKSNGDIDWEYLVQFNSAKK